MSETGTKQDDSKAGSEETQGGGGGGADNQGVSSPAPVEGGDDAAAPGPGSPAG